MFGFLKIDKPAAMTSAAAVNSVKRLLPRGTKVGHAGTLDPFATGLLVILIGKATKRCEELMDQPKQYEGTIRLGATAETDDPESPPQVVGRATPPTESAVRDALMRFKGDIQQIPPVYSALKIAGKRACDRVRAGETVELKPRTVRIYDIVLVDYAWPDAKVRIDCGRGTYIRAIARDLGQMLGVGGYLTALRRTRSGSFQIEHAVTLEQLSADGVERHLVTPDNPVDPPGDGPPTHHSAIPA
jgi:tRNA pseudouridine55 synthase